MLPLTSITATRPLNLQHFVRGLMAAILLSNLVIAGCDTSASDTDSEKSVTITADTVIVDKSLIHTSIPERYQPSYNLEGSLIPVNQMEVTAPESLASSVIDSKVLVKKGDVVKQGQIVAEYVVRVDDHKARALVSDFTEVYIDGNKIEEDALAELNPMDTDNPKPINNPSSASDKAPEKPSLSQPKTKVTNTATNDSVKSDNTVSHSMNDRTGAQPDANNARETLITATLVQKSPIEGEVTQISNHMVSENGAGNLNTSSQLETESHKSNKTTPNTVPKNSAPSNSKSHSNEPSNSKPTSNQSSSSDNAIDNVPIITIADTKHLQLIGRLPLSIKSQLSVGRPVNFTVFDIQSEFTGQISHIIPDPESDTLIVKAPLVPGENSAESLAPGMDAAMSIEYGQIELGVRLPKQAIHEANLQNFSDKHPRPTSPIKGYVWIVGQDQRLTYEAVEIVQYFADSDKFLVSGINNDSLVCIADLPKDSVGKTISIK